MMFSLNDKVPEYLLGKYQLLMTVNFTALFSLLFLIVSIPFATNPWFELDTKTSVGFTVIFFFISLVVVAVSRKLMYDGRKKYEMTFLHYILWSAAEVIIICSLYTLFTVEASNMGIIVLRQATADLFCNSLVYCVISLAIPYVLAGMYFAIQDKDKIIRMTDYASVVSDETIPSHEENKITLFDNNGILKLSVSASNLYYIESDDNYIKVWYMDSKGVLKQYMLRCRLKTVEDSFRGSDLVRCHRKYIVNISKVQVLSKEREGYMLDLGIEGIESIPVTKTYEETVLSRFNSVRGA